jgi:glycosyltransferase involved in cell wall biosynthesis
MRVLIAAPQLGAAGGVETYLRAVLPRLLDAGFELAVLGAQGHTADGIASECPGIPLWNAAEKPVATILREIEEWNPGVVYDNGLTSARLQAELLDRFPAILSGHNYHGTCISGTKCHSFPGYAACGREFGPACLALYLPRGCGGRNPLTMWRMYQEQRRRRESLDGYRAVLVASRHMAEEYRRHGVRDDRLRLLPLFPAGITPDPEPPSARPRTDRVLFMGRITRLKGLDHLVEAMPLASTKLGRTLTLVVAGEGPERAPAEAQARRLGVRAQFLGWVPAERRITEMRSADVLAVPSVWPEPFGLVGPEAGCVGLPAVGYATGGITDWLIPGGSGESAPGKEPDPAQLSAALVRALSDDAHWQRLRVGAWEMAKTFSVDAHCRTLCETLRRFHPSSRGTAAGAS